MRIPRIMSGTQVYHIMTRGNEKKNIFLDYNDRLKFLDILSSKGENGEFILYAYCLMPNHVHLIIKEEDKNISTIMSTINTTYAIFFNKKYDRVGHVFQGRFKSEPIETYEYLLTAIRYVHNNPVKAKLAKSRESYQWSSFRAYLNGVSDVDVLDTNFLLEMISPVRSEAISQFKKFSALPNEDSFLDIEDDMETKKLTTKNDIRNYIKVFLSKNNINYSELMNDKRNIKLRDELIKQLKNNSNLSVRKLADLLEIDRNIVQRA